MNQIGPGLLAIILFGAIASFSATAMAQGSNPRVSLQTNYGAITLELDQAKAPVTVANFLKYVDSGHYNKTVFHRVIGPGPRFPKGFMIQGGGFSVGVGNNPPTEKDTNAPIKNEADNGLANEPGTIAMARTSDPNSATAQFFINLDNNSFLNHRDRSQQGYGYAVFGKVVEGMDVVVKIGNVQTAQKPLAMQGPGGNLLTRPNSDVPVEPVIIESATRVNP